MKKRIIAALTALVMVVTMIPANAFAKTLTPEEEAVEIVKMIYDAAGIKDTDTNGELADETKAAVPYTKESLAKIDAAVKAVDDFGKGNEELIKKAVVTGAAQADANILNKLDMAVNAFNQYLKALKGFNDASAAIKAGTLTSEDGKNIKGADPSNDVAKNLVDAYGKLNTLSGGYEVTAPIKPDAEVASGTITMTFDDLSKITDASKIVDVDNVSAILKSKLVYNSTPDAAEAKYVSYKTADAAGLVNNVKFTKKIFGDTPAVANESAAKFFQNIAGLTVEADVDGMDITNFNGGAVSEIVANPLYEYAYLSSNYGVAAKAFQKYEGLNADLDALKNAPDLTKVDFNGTPIDATKASGSATEHAAVNAETYDAVKAAFDTANKAAKDFETKYPGKDNGSALSNLKTTLAMVATPDDETVAGTLEVCKAAMDSAKIIEDLYTRKDKITFEDYSRFNEITFADVDKIDAYLSNNDITVKKNAVAKKYAAVKKAMDEFKTNVAPNDFGKHYGDQIKAAIDKIPTLSTLSVTDYDVVKAAVDAINTFGTAAKNSGINAKDTIKFPVTMDATDGLKHDNNTAILAKDALLSTYNELKASTLKQADIDKLYEAAKIVSADQAGMTDVDKNLKTYLSELEKLANIKTVTTSIEYGTAVAAEKTYDEAYAKLTDKEKSYVAKNSAYEANLKAANNAKEMIKKFAAITDRVVVDKCEKAVAAIEKMIVQSAGSAVIDDIYSYNKPLIDEVNGYFADPIVKYVFLNATTDKDFAGKTKAYDDKKTNSNKFAKVVAEYEEHVIQTPEAAVDAVKKMISELKPFPAKDVTFADVDERIAAYNAAKAAYDKLDATQKKKVTNYAKLGEFDKSIVDNTIACIRLEMAKIIKIYNGVVDDNQKAIVKNVDELLAKYATVLGKDNYVANADIYAGSDVAAAAGEMFKNAFANQAGNTQLYVEAKRIIKASEKEGLVKEITKEYDAIKAGTNFIASKDVTNYADAKVVLDAIAAYNRLSAEAKALFVTTEFGTLTTGKLSPAGAEMKAADPQELNVLVASEKKAKSFFLENATVDAIADQKLPEDGSAVTPAVVVKDAMGNVIDAKNYKVEYANNTVTGTAKVIIDAVGTVYTGRVEATFNIVADAATVKPEKVTVKTDQGIIKVTANKVEGLSYRFMVKQKGAKNWKTINTKSNVATFTGLVKNARYEVKVATVLGKEVSEFNNAGFVYTNKLGNKSAMMYKAAINKVTINKGVAKITAKNVAYKGEKYRVGYKKYGTKNFKWNVWGTNTVKTVKGLKKGVKYTFTIQYRYVSEVSGTYVYSKYSKYVVKKAK